MGGLTENNAGHWRRQRCLLGEIAERGYDSGFSQLKAWPTLLKQARGQTTRCFASTPNARIQELAHLTF